MINKWINLYLVIIKVGPGDLQGMDCWCWWSMLIQLEPTTVNSQRRDKTDRCKLRPSTCCRAAWGEVSWSTCRRAGSRECISHLLSLWYPLEICHQSWSHCEPVQQGSNNCLGGWVPAYRRPGGWHWSKASASRDYLELEHRWYLQSFSTFV